MTPLTARSDKDIAPSLFRTLYVELSSVVASKFWFKFDIGDLDRR